jgi:hypothetical protein
MKRLTRKLAERIAHEVACWLEYERVTGGIESRICPWTGESWSVGPDLAGGCWLASFIVRRVLESMGIRSGVVYDEMQMHAYVTTACGWTLDPTFGQFMDGKAFPIEPNVARTRDELERYNEGIPARVLLNAEGRVMAAGWPGNHKPVLERILRRMGVETLEAT